MTAAAGRHPLFGLLALQNATINQGQLVAAFQAWTLYKSKGLAEHLEARGDLTRAKRAVLEALADVHLRGKFTPRDGRQDAPGRVGAPPEAGLRLTTCCSEPGPPRGPLI